MGIIFAVMKNDCMKTRNFLCLLFALAIASFSVRAEIKSYSKTAVGVDFVLDKGLMQVDVLSADVVRVRYTSLDAWAEKQSLVVKASLPDQSQFAVTEGAKE